MELCLPNEFASLFHADVVLGVFFVCITPVIPLPAGGRGIPSTGGPTPR